MKKWIFVAIGYIVLLVILFIVFRDRGNIEEKWKVTTANLKAYDELLSSSKDKSAAYQLTIDQLNYVNDSILKELNNTRNILNIKNKNLKSMQHITSTLGKTDTIVLQDTILSVKVNIDTTFQDDWYSLNMKLQYPDTVVVSPVFKSEKAIFVSTRKETINPPKKWWILRLFQKKHKVMQVDVVEKNPYVTDSESRYVEIIK